MNSNVNLMYCVKCKKKVEYSNGSIKTNKRGGKYIQASCNICNTKVNQFLKKDTVLEPIGGETNN